MAITESLTVAELKNIAKFHNLDHSGKKMDIFGKIEAFCQTKNIQRDSNGFFLINKDSHALVSDESSEDGENHDEIEVTSQANTLETDVDGLQLGNEPLSDNLRRQPSQRNLTFTPHMNDINPTREKMIEQHTRDIKKIEHVPADGFESLFDTIEQITYMHGITDQEKNFIIGTKIAWRLLTKINYRKNTEYAITKRDIQEFYGETWESTQNEISNFERLKSESLIQTTSRLFSLLNKPDACFQNQHLKQKTQILNRIFKRIMHATFYNQFHIL